MSTPDTTLRFTEAELVILGKTADGLSAYMGVCVLAEIGCDVDSDAEWVIFATPVAVDEEPDDKTLHVQMGWPGATFVGGRGGLDLDTETYDCRYMWAIQITEDPEARFVRLDEQGEEFDFSNDLAGLLPFDLTDEALPDPDLELLEEINDDMPDLDDDDQAPDDFDRIQRPKGPLH